MKNQKPLHVSVPNALFAVWSTTCSNPEVGAVPFLPTNPHLSATRNQGRQKLARFSHAEFCGLLSDILVDASRRKNIANLRPLEQAQMRGNRESTNSDDEPLYDAVCEDDDYGQAALPSSFSQQVKNLRGLRNTNSVD
jgi:G protein-coupled receptor kinase interacting protein 2